MESLRERKKRETRLKVLTSAQQLFLDKGFDATSVNQIAATAGISRASLFNYFPAKADILQAMAKDTEGRLVALVDHYRTRPGSTAQRIEALFAYAGKVAGQTAGLTRLVYAEGARRAPDTAQLGVLTSAFADLLLAGRAQADVRVGLAVEPMAEILSSAFMAGILGWFDETADQTHAHFRRRAKLIIELIAEPGDDPG
jgi:AcrR family transcriptional regulator